MLWLSNFESDTAINKLESVALNSVFLQLDAFTWQSYKKIMSCQSLANVQEDNPTHLLSAVEAGEQHYLTIQDKYTNALSNFTLSQDNKSMQCILCMTTMQDIVCIFVAHCPVAGYCECVTWPKARE